MAASNYDACLVKTLRYEGGYSNHPSDPGGPTNWGITIHDARAYWKRDATAADVKAMPLGVAKEIYRTKYWGKMNCDADPAGVDLCTFDSGVNSGVGRGVKWRSAAAGLSPVAAVKKMCAIRLSFLHGLRTWGVFGKGWGSRVADVEATGVKMALQAAGHPPEVVKKKLEAESKNAKAKRDVQIGGSVIASTPAGTKAPTVDWSFLPMAVKVALGMLVAFVIVWVIWHIVNSHQRAQAYAAVAKEV